MYYGLHDINNLNNDSSSLGILHTNLASLNKYHDDLEQILSLMKVDFQIIGITERKIKEVTPISNIKLAGYHEFIYTPTQTSHGGSGFYIRDSLAFKKRNDLLLNSPGSGDFESTFLEIVLPNKKNLIVGCIYRHPSSKITIEDFTKNYLDPILITISAENKTCALVGDYKIDLLKSDTHDDINLYQNTLSSHFFSPYILQPTRPISQTLIDNIFLNTIEYVSYSGNITIQLADHLFQFVLLQGFFHDAQTEDHNIKGRNFKNFNEREFLEAIQNINIDDVLCLDYNDPNISIDNFYNNINYILDEFASFKKLNKGLIKLKTKPWINKEAQHLMWERYKLFKKFRTATDDVAKNIYF